MFKYLVYYKRTETMWNGKTTSDYRACYIQAERIQDVPKEFKKISYHKNHEIDNIICQDSYIDVYAEHTLLKEKVARIRTYNSMCKYGNCSFVEMGVEKEDEQRKTKTKRS